MGLDRTNVQSETLGGKKGNLGFFHNQWGRVGGAALDMASTQQWWAESNYSVFRALLLPRKYSCGDTLSTATSTLTPTLFTVQHPDLSFSRRLSENSVCYLQP